MKIREITDHLESIAPLRLQESYDNCGLLTGHHETEVRAALITLDCTEEVVNEAVETGCNLIIAHHPVIFGGLKRLNGYSYVERTVILAIKYDIAIYAWHTNLDSVYNGVNARICDRLKLSHKSVLRPVKNLMKLVTFIPKDHTNEVMRAVFDAGAGQIGGYTDCSFRITGTGTFTPGAEANPFEGKPGVPSEVQEDRVEVIFPDHRQQTIMKALTKAHPYEEVAYYLSRTENSNQEEGAGMIGILPKEMEQSEFLDYLKEAMNLQVVRHTRLPEGTRIKKVAVCGGSGRFLLNDARAAGAEAFVSADFKYHEFFDHENRIMIADIGHYESEIFTKDLIRDFLKEKFTTFAVNLSKTITNPISYR